MLGKQYAMLSMVSKPNIFPAHNTVSRPQIMLTSVLQNHQKKKKQRKHWESTEKAQPKEKKRACNQQHLKWKGLPNTFCHIEA